eukprot:3199511-Lingulodinium_polyedra.AAC.1
MRRRPLRRPPGTSGIKSGSGGRPRNLRYECPKREVTFRPSLPGQLVRAEFQSSPAMPTSRTADLSSSWT